MGYHDQRVDLETWAPFGAWFNPVIRILPAKASGGPHMARSGDGGVTQRSKWDCFCENLVVTCDDGNWKEILMELQKGTFALW